MFDYRFDLKWEAPDLDCGLAKGVLMYPDVGQDCEGVYDVECRVSQHNNTKKRKVSSCFFSRSLFRLGTHSLRLLLWLYLERPSLSVVACMFSEEKRGVFGGRVASQRSIFLRFFVVTWCRFFCLYRRCFGRGCEGRLSALLAVVSLFEHTGSNLA